MDLTQASPGVPVVSVQLRVSHNAHEVERDLLAIPAKLEAAVARSVREGTQILRNELVAEVVRRTSMDVATAERIVEASATPQRGEVGFTQPRPYTIEAKNAKALSFIWGGRRVFFQKVRHPGSRPYKLVGIAGASSERLIQERTQENVADALGSGASDALR